MTQLDQTRYDAAYTLLHDRLWAGRKTVQDDLRVWEDEAEEFARIYALRTEFTDPAAFWPVFSNERWLRRNPGRAADTAKVARPRTHREALGQ